MVVDQRWATKTANQGYCGFNQVRRHDDGGYFCSFCGTEMPDNFALMVETSLSQKWIDQLNEQCSGN